MVSTALRREGEVEKSRDRLEVDFVQSLSQVPCLKQSAEEAVVEPKESLDCPDGNSGCSRTTLPALVAGTGVELVGNFGLQISQEKLSIDTSQNDSFEIDSDEGSLSSNMSFNSLPDLQSPRYCITPDKYLNRCSPKPQPKRNVKTREASYMDVSEEESEQYKIDEIIGRDSEDDEYEPSSGEVEDYLNEQLHDEVVSDREFDICVTPPPWDEEEQFNSREVGQNSLRNVSTSDVSDINGNQLEQEHVHGSSKFKRLDRGNPFSIEKVEYDPYPSIEHIGNGVFRLPGSQRPIYVTPLLNDCVIDGKRTRSNWCRHLISAGMRLSPPINVIPKKIHSKSLTHLNNSQKISKVKSGRKRPRPFDYQEVDFNDGVNSSNPSNVQVWL